MPEDFEKFMKNIPEEVAVPAEKNEQDPVEKSEDVLNELAALGERDSTKERRIELLPEIKELISDLRELQNKGSNNAEIQNAIVRLVNEKDKIEILRN